MEFVCKMRYDRKAMAALSRVLRKTVRARRARLTRLFSWLVIAFCLLSAALERDDPGRLAINGAAVLLLVLLNWKGDALNGFLASRRALSNMESTRTVFYPDCYEMQMTGVTARWQYDQVCALAETQRYLVFLMGRNYTHAFDKTELEGGSQEDFRRFLEERTGKPIQRVKG